MAKNDRTTKRTTKSKLPGSTEHLRSKHSGFPDNLVVVDKKVYRSALLKSIREKAATLPDGPI